MRAGFFFAMIGLGGFVACGGSTSGDGTSTGGTSAGGTHTGGTNAGGTHTGGTGTGGTGTGGTAGCGGGGLNGDCVDPCTNQFTFPVCENGHWTCPHEACPDAGGDGAACATGEVPTVDGCLSCNDATLAYEKAIDAARAANAACNTEADCVLADASTTCSGSCQVAVSQSGASAFAAALGKIDADYCSGFVPVCGYSTPKCALPTLVCNAGSCDLVFK